MNDNLFVFNSNITLKCVDFDNIVRKDPRWRLLGRYEPLEELMFEHVMVQHKPQTFLNIGSFVGYYVIYARKLLPSVIVHAIEPEPICRDTFYQNLKLNDINESGIIVWPIGIETTQYKENYSIDKLIESIGDVPDFILMDVQGAELPILRNMSRIKEVKHWLIGTHATQNTHQACLDLLKKNNCNILVEFPPKSAWLQNDGVIWAMNKEYNIEY